MSDGSTQRRFDRKEHDRRAAEKRLLECEAGSPEASSEEDSSDDNDDEIAFIDQPGQTRRMTKEEMKDYLTPSTDVSVVSAEEAFEPFVMSAEARPFVPACGNKAQQVQVEEEEDPRPGPGSQMQGRFPDLDDYDHRLEFREEDSHQHNKPFPRPSPGGSREKPRGPGFESTPRVPADLQPNRRTRCSPATPGPDPRRKGPAPTHRRNRSAPAGCTGFALTSAPTSSSRLLRVGQSRNSPPASYPNTNHMRGGCGSGSSAPSPSDFVPTMSPEHRMPAPFNRDQQGPPSPSHHSNNRPPNHHRSYDLEVKENPGPPNRNPRLRSNHGARDPAPANNGPPRSAPPSPAVPASRPREPQQHSYPSLYDPESLDTVKPRRNSEKQKSWKTCHIAKYKKKIRNDGSVEYCVDLKAINKLAQEKAELECKITTPSSSEAEDDEVDVEATHAPAATEVMIGTDNDDRDNTKSSSPLRESSPRRYRGRIDTTMFKSDTHSIFNDSYSFYTASIASPPRSPAASTDRTE